MLRGLSGSWKTCIYQQRKSPCKKMTPFAVHRVEKREFWDRWQIRTLGIYGETMSLPAFNRIISASKEP
jgi:hypothetical protein